MRIFDAHTHLHERSFPRADGFSQLAVASTPKECIFLEEEARKNSDLYYACGLHPWRSAEQPLEALLPWFATCSAIGEIGMDSVWCQVDVEMQRKVFRKQLAIAEELKKPIVLHTKGCEREILLEVSNVSQNILVHWYSCNEHLASYIEKGCYFTVGPDFLQNEAVQSLVDEVPLQKLMLESDGASGVSWALGREVLAEEIPSFLEQQVLHIAKRKRLNPDFLAEVLYENAVHFLEQSV